MNIIRALLAAAGQISIRALRQGHAVEFIHSDEAENGYQAGKGKRATLDDGQYDDRQKDEGGNQAFDD